MKSIFFKFLVLCCVVSACKFNPNVPKTGADFLQGEWVEDSIRFENELISYEKYKLKFICDSFYLEINNYSKANLDGGECYKNNTWKEYAKGVYTIVNDSLVFDGAYVTAEYRYKPQNSCYRFGKLLDEFSVLQKSTDTIEIKSQKSSLSHTLVLKNKLNCSIEK